MAALGAIGKKTSAKWSNGYTPKGGSTPGSTRTGIARPAIILPATVTGSATSSGGGVAVYGGGPAGPAGPPGPATFITGTGAPTSGTGVDGAMYLDTATGHLYGPKASGVWPATMGRILIPGNTYADVKADYNNYAALLAG